MEDAQGDVAVTEPIEESSDSLFVVVGRETFKTMSVSFIHSRADYIPDSLVVSQRL